MAACSFIKVACGDTVAERVKDLELSEVQEITLTIQHKVGLHARPAALFVQTANRFQSEIMVEKDGKLVDAKSILSVLTLGATQGTVVIVRAEGPDESEAAQALKELVESNFGEV